MWTPCVDLTPDPPGPAEAPGPVTIATYPATAVPAALADELLAEHTLPTGEMAKVFRACANPNRRDWTGTALVATAGGDVLGWALRWRCFAGSDWNLHLFVAPRWRRHGVGTALVAASHRRLRRGTVVHGFRWDDTSDAFWDSIDLPDTVSR